MLFDLSGNRLAIRYTISQKPKKTAPELPEIRICQRKSFLNAPVRMCGDLRDKFLANDV